MGMPLRTDGERVSDRARIDLDKMLECLGISWHEWVLLEEKRFELSPHEWFHQRLRQQGYIWVSTTPPAGAEKPTSSTCSNPTHSKDCCLP